jgi:precorrin-8X/cobalt-precorrin-8 methylmutase
LNTGMLEGSDIEAQSLAIIDKLLPPLRCSNSERQVIKRIVHATGDPKIAKLVKFHPDAIDAGVVAIRAGKVIFTDGMMVAVGINKRQIAREFGCSIHCALDEVDTFRHVEKDVTRSAAAILTIGPRLNGALVAIGNAPTALLALLNLIDNGISPCLVVGMPVGFIQAEEAKLELTRRSVPYITIIGKRGGSAATAATVNALLHLALAVQP